MPPPSQGPSPRPATSTATATSNAPRSVTSARATGGASSYRASKSSRGPESGPVAASKNSHHTLAEDVEEIMQQMKQQAEDYENAVDVRNEPAPVQITYKFADFYNSEMMLHFLHTARECFRSFLKPEVSTDATQSREESRGARGAADQQEAMRKLGQHYSRIVLHCSNFENAKEDELFFECLFCFSIFVLKRRLEER